MSDNNCKGLRQLAAVADVPTFLHLVSSEACASLIRKKHGNDIRKLQREGYSALVLAALSKGLQLCNAAVATAVAAAQPGRPHCASKELQQLMYWLELLAVAAINNVDDCSLVSGESSHEARNMEQELLDSGVLPLMQQSWRQLAADMEQQQQHLQQHLQRPDSTQQPDSATQPSTAHAVLYLGRSATLTGFLLQLWVCCLTDNLTEHEHMQPSRLNVAISSVEFLEDVATGIAAIWRSEGVLQQCCTASRDAVPSAPATYGVLDAAAHGGSAGEVASAHRIQRSTRLQVDLQAGEKAAASVASAVTNSFVAAKKLALWLFIRPEKHAGKLQLPASGAAYELQWVLLVYTAHLVSELHQQQQGISLVQLHTNQLTADTTSNGQQGSPGSSSSTGSNSVGKNKTSSNGKGSQKGSSRKASQAQQASSSNTAASRVLGKQQGSVVPPYHLQVLETAGVLPHSLTTYFDSIQLIEGGVISIALMVLCTVLHELGQHLSHIGQPQAAATTGADAGTSSSSTCNSSATTITTTSNSSHSSTMDGSSRPLAGSAAAVLALLPPSSLMWGELLVFLAGAGAAAAVNLLKVEGLVVWAWHTSLHSVQQQASVVQVDQLPQLLRAVELAGVQLAPDMPLEQQLEEKLSELQMTACQDSWYRSCVELIVPSLLHMRAAGTMDSARYATAAKSWFGRLEVMLDARIYAVANASLFESSISLPQGLRPSLAIFSNPAASIPSLEAAVRHNWDACTAPGEDSTGLKLACYTMQALVQDFMPVWESLLLDEHSTLLQYARSSSRIPALLLSCVKQLQHNCQRNPHVALKIAGLAGMAGDLASRLLIELGKSTAGTATVLHGSSSAEPCGSISSSERCGLLYSTSSTEAPSRSHATVGQDGNTRSVLTAAATAPSTGVKAQPQATSGCDMPAGRGVSAVWVTAEDISAFASTWVVLLGRVLCTAGAALQAVAAGAAPRPGASSALSVGMVPIPTTATQLITDFQEFAAFACTYLGLYCGAVGSRSVQVKMPCGAAARSALRAQQALDVLLSAVAQHAKRLEEAAGASISGGNVDTVDLTLSGQLQSGITSVGVWRQVLGSEQGRQLPQALMDVGSLLCTALPSRSCCNEPSCCCLDKPSELQLAAGKGTKCSDCGVARYCSVAHQRLHWKQHKPVCRAIAAAAAAAVASK